uniref:Uncharacterized protein n=1 Tax=Panagrolaimus sp. ES5 TaxID=591445 RepID=A0AC34F0B8_9BILA
MRFILTIFVILFLAILIEASRQRFFKSNHAIPRALDNSNPSAGYIFMGEQSICSCRENIVFLNFAKYLADNIIPYGCNGYGIRQFGDKAFNDTNLLQGYYSRDGLEWRINNWISDDLSQNCKYSDNVTYQSALLDILQLVQGSGAQAYQKNAIFLQGETDTIVDLDVSLAIARQIASYNAIIYIWDHSRYGDQTGLFSVLTKYQQNRIIYSNASLLELINVAKRNSFSDFANIGCGNFSTTTPPPPSEPALPVEPGYCPNIMPKYTTTSAKPSPTTTTTIIKPTTTTQAPTTTTRPSTRPPTTTTTTTRKNLINLATTTTTRPSPPPTTTTTYNPTSNNTCYKIIFAGEMSGSITLAQKQTFYNVVLQIAAHLPIERLQFGITTYGMNIFQNLIFQNYQNFVATVNGLVEQLPNPNSSLTYVQKPYDEILFAATSNPNQKVAALVMGQMEYIRDPNAGHTAALKIAATGTNVYVLDYSIGTLQTTLWPFLTNYHSERIVNGTGKSANEVYNVFQKTLINDVINNHC